MNAQRRIVLRASDVRPRGVTFRWRVSCSTDSAHPPDEPSTTAVLTLRGSRLSDGSVCNVSCVVSGAGARTNPSFFLIRPKPRCVPTASAERPGRVGGQRRKKRSGRGASSGTLRSTPVLSVRPSACSEMRKKSIPALERRRVRGLGTHRPARGSAAVGRQPRFGKGRESVRGRRLGARRRLDRRGGAAAAAVPVLGVCRRRRPRRGRGAPLIRRQRPGGRSVDLLWILFSGHADGERRGGPDRIGG